MILCSGKEPAALMTGIRVSELRIRKNRQFLSGVVWPSDANGNCGATEPLTVPSPFYESHDSDQGRQRHSDNQRSANRPEEARVVVRRNTSIGERGNDELQKPEGNRE
jgi:hypothetical protein